MNQLGAKLFLKGSIADRQAVNQSKKLFSEELVVPQAFNNQFQLSQGPGQVTLSRIQLSVIQMKKISRI